MTEPPPAVTPPPGRAVIENCPGCKGTPGRDCCECNGTGKILWRACPLCGDIAWDYVNGVNDRDGMACRISCGYRWTASDPGWLAQRLPSTPRAA
ncbi:MAG: hypothetical protein ACLP52_27785 [Streptosporangiaceae bacterium]